MFAKASWFQKRKYGGWGITPKTKEGWMYIGVFMAILIIFQALPFWGDLTRLAFTGIWLAILSFDVIRIMFTLEKDELEKIQEATAERNASWAMVLILIIGILYQSFQSGFNQTIEFDPFLAMALFAGLIAKSLSYYFMERK